MVVVVVVVNMFLWSCHSTAKLLARDDRMQGVIGYSNSVRADDPDEAAYWRQAAAEGRWARKDVQRRGN